VSGLLGLGFLLLSGCGQGRQDYQELLIVYTTLNPQNPVQTVILDRSCPVEESVPPPGQALTGARVLLKTTDGRDSALLTDSAQPGFYRLHPVSGRSWVLPCSSYDLTVDLDTFSGRTRIAVPDTFQVVRPSPGEILTDTSIPPFVWRRSNIAAGYRLVVRHADTLLDTLPGFRLPLVVPDTFLDLRPFYQGYFDSTGDYLVKFYALDTHLFRPGGPVSSDTLGPGMLGDVGALTSRVVPVRYVRLRPGAP
jgi:hypothetical protein